MFTLWLTLSIPLEQSVTDRLILTYFNVTIKSSVDSHFTCLPCHLFTIVRNSIGPVYYGHKTMYYTSDPTVEFTTFYRVTYSYYRILNMLNKVRFFNVIFYSFNQTNPNTEVLSCRTVRVVTCNNKTSRCILWEIHLQVSNEEIVFTEEVRLLICRN